MARMRRHDYNVDIAGGYAAAQLTTDYLEVDGMKLPMRRRAISWGGLIDDQYPRC